MYDVIYADGTTDKCEFWATTPDGDILMIAMVNKSFIEMAQIFSDKEKTKEMKFLKNEELLSTEKNYTRVVRLSYESSGIRVTLKKEI